MVRTYRYSFDRRLILFWAPFGVRPAKDWVTLTDGGRLVATFGLLKLETPLENISGAHITRNYRWWTAAGARGSMKDDGLTFGTHPGRLKELVAEVKKVLPHKPLIVKLSPNVEDVTQIATGMMGGHGGVSTVGVGSRPTCVRRSDGTVACWADPCSADPSTPAKVASLTNVAQIAIGGTDGCVRKTDGTPLDGHAWLEHNGQPVFETTQPDYLVTYAYP